MILEKEIRSIYNNTITKFTENLTNISLILKTFNIFERQNQLTHYLTKTNLWLQNQKARKNEYKECALCAIFEGIIFPFSKKDNAPFYSNLVKQRTSLIMY